MERPDSAPGLRWPGLPNSLRSMDHRKRLKKLLVERSVRLGEFTLASGGRSSYYIDARTTSMTAEGQALVGRVCFDHAKGSGCAATHVGGLTMGADPVAYAIAHQSWLAGEPIDAFSVRKQAKSHGTRRRIEGGVDQDARCLIIEDSMTSGRSALEAVHAIRGHGAHVVGVLTLVDREEGGRQVVESSGVPLFRVFTGSELLEAARRQADQSSNRNGMTKQR